MLLLYTCRNCDPYCENHKVGPINKTMESQLLLCILLAYLPLMIAQDSAIISIDGSHNIANIDENFVCATLDWWPPDKCDFGQCQWGNTSILNLVSILIIFLFNITLTKRQEFWLFVCE